jgi:hypothetical protein
MSVFIAFLLASKTGAGCGLTRNSHWPRSLVISCQLATRPAHVYDAIPADESYE